MHATGIYPDWWQGLRIEKVTPLRMWVGGVTSIVTRDVIQRKLMGSPGEEGTGFIPAANIHKTIPARGVPGALDNLQVRHRNGTITSIYFKSYEQGREKWQADTIDFLWFDEEPPIEIWTEGLARLTATRGAAILTFTPLLGMSEVVRAFYPSPDASHKSYVRMGLKDALHIKPEDRAEILSQYPKHQRDARLEGIPMLGSGRIYEIQEELIVCSPFEIPRYWRRIVGLDIGGGNHPTAWVAIAHDLDTDTMYVYDCYREKDPRIAIHASSMRRLGKVPVAWPKDGHTREKTDGIKIADIYRREGVNMLHEHAQWPDKTVSIEAGIHEIHSRLTDGRFKCFYHLGEWLDEYRTYHRKNGEIVKLYEDLMDATRYAVMMSRYAKTTREHHRVPSVRGLDYEVLEDRPKVKRNTREMFH